jgi:hypothetical protein
LFSTINGAPSLACRRSPRMRPMLSGVDPGAKGTTMRTFRDGQFWALTGLWSAPLTVDRLQVGN